MANNRWPQLGLRCRVGILLVIIAGPALADWRSDYDRGLKAYAAGDYAGAEAAFKAAIADAPTPEARKRFQGMRFDPYVPQYYAGLAAQKQGRCDDALRYLNQRASAQAVSAIPALAGAQSAAIKACESRVAVNAPATPSKSPMTTPSQTPPVRNTASPTEAATPPKRQPSTPVPPVVAKTTPPKPAAAPPVPPAARQASAGQAPALLRSAVVAFLTGQFDQVLAADPAKLASANDRAQLHLLRAAALHSRAEASDDAALRAKAQAEVRAARQRAPQLAPDATLYSPRFRAFYKAG